jgi:hypothetical protein
MPSDNNMRTTSSTKRAESGRNNGGLDDALKNTFPASDPVAMLEPGAASPDRPVIENEVQARQGVTGHNVRYVLAYGIVGVVIAFAIIYLLYRV